MKITLECLKYHLRNLPKPQHVHGVIDPESPPVIRFYVPVVATPKGIGHITPANADQMLTLANCPVLGFTLYLKCKKRAYTYWLISPKEGIFIPISEDFDFVLDGLPDPEEYFKYSMADGSIRTVRIPLNYSKELSFNQMVNFTDLSFEVMQIGSEYHWTMELS